MTSANELVAELSRRGHTIATAESLTGGRLCARLIDVPGASAVVAGGITAYTAEAKVSVLGVDQATIAAWGTVSEQVAMSMAARAVEKFGSTWAIATTGVAGPDRSERKPVGRVHIGIADAYSTVHRVLDLPGDREAIRAATVDASVSFLAAKLGEQTDRQ